MATRYQMECGNTNVGALNTALWDLHIEDGSVLLDSIIVAQMVAMSVYMLQASGSYVAGCRKTESGAAGSTPLPFPETEYAALKAENDDLPDMDDWGAGMGLGELTALGTGVTINEYTPTPGRSTTGRIYTPYLRRTALNTATGTVSAATISAITTGYEKYILGLWGDGATPLGAVVYSPKLNTETSITAVTVSVRPCRLKTRTR